MTPARDGSRDSTAATMTATARPAGMDQAATTAPIAADSSAVAILARATSASIRRNRTLASGDTCVLHGRCRIASDAHRSSPHESLQREQREREQPEPAAVPRSLLRAWKLRQTWFA